MDYSYICNARHYLHRDARHWQRRYFWRHHKSHQTQVLHLRPFMNAFYASGALILLRSIYRAIEFLSLDFSTHPATGYFFNVEWAYYVLDALPIALATLIYNIWYPAKYLPKSKKVAISKDEEYTMTHSVPQEERS
ncbi:hypothetical protein FRC18_005185 [Serendipita sp. 400]|nr:hypothetical protein FRC18_005185 [Serendipita sp. 400]